MESEGRKPMWTWPRRRRQSDPVGEVTDVEAFLLGRSVEYFREHHQPVPPWAWLNTVAHRAPGTMDELRVSAVKEKGGTADGAGRTAVETIATALWRQTGGDAAAIGALQRQFLIPLELALMAGRIHAPDARGVAQLAVVTLHARRCPPARPPDQRGQRP
jgi:hypothetical protein